MKADTAWRITAFLLVLLIASSLLSLIANWNAYLAQTGQIKTIYGALQPAPFFILEIAALVLFLMKKKIGFHITVFIAGITVLTTVLNLILMQSPSNAILQPNSFIGPSFITLSLDLVFMLIIAFFLFSTWKSRPLFFETKE